MNNIPKVLVAGGAGYIGSHCCKALFASGYQPICFDNFSTGHRKFAKWGPSIEGDIHDVARLTDSIRDHSVIAVMHFAASSLVGESVIDPEKYYANNVAGTLALLQSMRRAGCSKLIFSSTGAVYGDAADELIREDAPTEPVNPYGRSKLMIEQMLGDFRKAYQLNSICLRYFNASGADSSGMIGEDRSPETHLIPRAMMALQDHVSDFAIYGDDYPTPDGTAIRDYIHVTDLASAHVSALRILAGDHPGGIYNLGTGRGYSVREVLSAIKAETGREVTLVVKRRRQGDPTFLVADPTLANQVLKFNPTNSDLATIVKTAWAWHQTAHPSGRPPGQLL
jgi:UDP-glucose-4-epimerase GalE